MSKRFEKALDAATEQTLVEPNWEGILECVDMIRGADVPVKDAIVLIQKRYHSANPHVTHHALLVLEACVKNCGKKFHVEVATKEFMDDLKNLVIAGSVEKVKEKILELIQCWASAFRDKPEYNIVNDTHSLLKMNGFEFPVMKEADAMFIADSAPDWVEGNNCYRCRTEFGVFTRKHHCRACGQIFCDKCSNKQMLLPQFGIEKRVRVCESCFDRKINQKSGGANTFDDSKQSNKCATEDEAREKARVQELLDKEAEDLQLALAISQSEAEAKEQERLSKSFYSNYGGATTNSSYVASKNSEANAAAVYTEIYKGAASNIEESTPVKIDSEEPPLDSVLAKYLDRDYWERKRSGKELEGSAQKATAPPPSEISVLSNASQFLLNDPQNRFDMSSRSADTIVESFHKLQLGSQQTLIDGDDVAETFSFCKGLKEQVDTMDNRMRSNLLRGRSIINDSAIHSLFAQLTNLHANVLSRMTKLESDREYFESLQDHLAHIQEARQAVNALREEHRRQRDARLLEEQQLRRVQMQQKLEFMRQKKHEMLVYGRHMALQRFQEQEQQIQQRRFLHQQQAMQLAAVGGGTMPILSTNRTNNYFSPHSVSGQQPQMVPHIQHQQFFQEPTSINNVSSQHQPSLSYANTAYHALPTSQQYYGVHGQQFQNANLNSSGLGAISSSSNKQYMNVSAENSNNMSAPNSGSQQPSRNYQQGLYGGGPVYHQPSAAPTQQLYDANVQTSQHEGIPQQQYYAPNQQHYQLSLAQQTHHDQQNLQQQYQQNQPATTSSQQPPNNVPEDLLISFD